MAYRELEHDEILGVLAGEQVVRVAFHDGDSHYIIPLGYAWLGEALWGVTSRGRKTEMAARAPTVAFQVDTSRSTGLYAWRSVTGVGKFEIVADASARQAALRALQPLVDGAPGWWREEQASRLGTGDFEAWRITPAELHGRVFGT